MADTGLFNNVYNPDVLSCLANLSNDEVFTPPDVVNAMLDMLPQELFPRMFSTHKANISLCVIIIKVTYRKLAVRVFGAVNSPA